MLSISRFDHIGQVVPDLEPQVDLLERLFGMKVFATWEDTNARARGVRLAVPGRSRIDWEVLQPLGPDSPLQAYVDSPRGPGIHHVGVQTPSLTGTAATLKELGIVARGHSSSCVDAWMNPGAVEGLLYRFAEDTAASCGAPSAGSPPLEAAPGTLGVKRIDHICQAYADRDVLARWFEGVAGYKEQWRTPDGEHDDLADLVMDVPGGQLSWEIIQPVGDSFIKRFVETRGPSAHHVTFEVADWDAAMAACEAAGVPTFDPNSGETDGGRWNDTFIHPKHAGGMLVQLFWEERPGLWVRSDKVPSA